MRPPDSYALAGFVAANLAVGAGIVLARLGGEPAGPELRVLGEQRAVAWHPLPADALDRPPWSRWPLPRIAAGSGEWRVEIVGGGRHTVLALPGPATGAARDLPARALFELFVPDRLGRKGHLRAVVLVTGMVSRDGAEYLVSFADASGWGTGHRLAFTAAFDPGRRELSVGIGWAFESGDGRRCRLRYRLTPEGFAFVDPSGPGAEPATAPGTGRR